MSNPKHSSLFLMVGVYTIDKKFTKYYAFMKENYKNCSPEQQNTSRRIRRIIYICFQASVVKIRNFPKKAKGNVLLIYMFKTGHDRCLCDEIFVQLNTFMKKICQWKKHQNWCYWDRNICWDCFKIYKMISIIKIYLHYYRLLLIYEQINGNIMH